MYDKGYDESVYTVEHFTAKLKIYYILFRCLSSVDHYPGMHACVGI